MFISSPLINLTFISWFLCVTIYAFNKLTVGHSIRFAMGYQLFKYLILGVHLFGPLCYTVIELFCVFVSEYAYRSH